MATLLTLAQLKAWITSLDRQEEILRVIHTDLFEQGASEIARHAVIETVHKLVTTRIYILNEYWEGKGE